MDGFKFNLTERTTRRLMHILPSEPTFNDIRLGLLALDTEDEAANALIADDGPSAQEQAERGGYYAFASSDGSGRRVYRLRGPDGKVTKAFWSTKGQAWVAGALAAREPVDTEKGGV